MAKGPSSSLIKKDALFLVDGSYLLYRSFYAIKPLHTSSGMQVQAIYGFCRTIKKLIDTFDPSRLIVVWDSKGGSFRQEVYTAYKATRQAPPNELFMQKDEILRFLDAVEICSIAQPGYEADDLIASLALHNKQHQTVIFCADKDMYQLLSDTIVIVDPFKDRIIDPVLFEEEQGFPPSKVPFFYALVGDTSDNIPGVKGVGKKTATEIVQQFKSLDDLYSHLDQIAKPRLRDLLREHESDARLSLQLFTLATPEVSYDPVAAQFDKSQWSRALPFFREFEFKSLVKEIEATLPEVSKKQGQQQASIFGTDTEPSEINSAHENKILSWKCHTIRTEHDLEELVQTLEKSAIVALDTEGTGPSALQDACIGLSFAYDTKQAFYVPFGHTGEQSEQQLSRDKVLAALKPVLENGKIAKVLHHAKFDALVLSHCGITLQGVCFDTMLAANLLRESWQKVNLKDLSQYYLHEPMQLYKDVVGKEHKNLASVPVDQVSQYAAHDALQTLKLYFLFKEKLVHYPVLHAYFEQLEMPLMFVLTAMENKGILLDASVLQQVEHSVVHDLKVLEGKIYAALPEATKLRNPDLNLNSPQQIEALLFDDLALPVVKKTSTGNRSTDQEVLLELRKVHPIPDLIVQHRELTKLYSTYLQPLPLAINPLTKRVHTSYNQTFVVTGRLSSTEPNLQNIPASPPYGIAIRSAFIAAPDCYLVSADYSQIELRVLAHVSGDKTLKKAFLHDEDVHLQTAAQLFKVEQKDVTTEQRQIGKRINFSIIYGLTPFGLSRDLGIPLATAHEYIDQFFSHYPGVAAWIEKTVAQAEELGYVTSWKGRRRFIPEIREKNKTQHNLGRRLAMNSPIQATSAEIMKIAMINLYARFKQENLESCMLLQIHDELIFEVPMREWDNVQEIICTEMDRVTQWEIPLKVAIRKGANWGEITK